MNANEYKTYYGDAYVSLRETQDILDRLAGDMQKAMQSDDDVQPIVYFCSRIKHPKSMTDKLAGRNLPTDAAYGLTHLYDAVGLRIICSFESDVAAVIEKLEQNPALEIAQKKDYQSYPKPNGYRSIHLCIRVPATDTRAEIQVRTIAMDCWATLEHQLKYKKAFHDSVLLQQELKGCADEIASLDLSMQTLRDILKDL